jgi:membrane-associated protease RseP (regulator of RpoE activity)
MLCKAFINFPAEKVLVADMDKKISAALVIALTIALFYAAIASSANGILKFAISLVIMGGCGLALQALLKIEGQHGLLLLRTKKGLKYIDDIAAAAPRFWQACADFGTVLGFGMSSIFFFKELPKKTFLFSMLALILVSQFLTGKVFTVIVALINLPMDLGVASGQMGSANPIVIIAALLSMLFFGLCGVTVVGLVLNTYQIVATIVGFLLSVPGSKLSNAVPGASPVIPGINMPLFEGVIALAVLLFVHEVSHGILSRIGKIKIESAGLLLFGAIPVGAFVDPDEKSLMKKDVDTQTRVFAAGSAANLIMFILAFFLLTGFEAVTVPYLDSSVHIRAVELNSSAQLAGITVGETLMSLDGIPITWDNIGQMGELVGTKDKVLLKTDKAEYEIVPKELGGKKTLGINVPVQRPYASSFGWLGFIKNTLGLVFVLNFLVGVINLIPLFMAFDGYRIFQLHTKSQLIIKLISYSLLIMFLLNFVPWLWH